MGQVARALIWHEFRERLRDRWVLVIGALFALLASGVSLYGRSADASAGLVGPSLVTLISLFVPLVALVLGHDAIVGERERNTLGLLLSLPIRRAEVVVAKFFGRAGAMIVATSTGLLAAILLAAPPHRPVLANLIGPTLLLGGAFLSVGLMLSTAVVRQVTAASLVVAIWFLFVFFYDLGLLGLMVITDGGVSEGLITSLVVFNPAGLFRLEMLARFAGPNALQEMGMATPLPPLGRRAPVWAVWVTAPVALSALLLARGEAVR